MKKGKHRPLACLMMLFFCVLTTLPAVSLAQDEFEIEVLGKKIPLNFDSKRGVIVIAGETLRSLPAADLSQLLNLAANMNFIARGSFQADPQIKGFNQEQVVVMVNGMPVNNAQTGHHNFDLPVDIENIEEIEILRGGYSSLAGYSGAGGMINIVTTGRKSLRIQRGSFDSTRVSANWNSDHIYASAGGIASDGYLPGTDGSKIYAQAGTNFAAGSSVFDVWGGWLQSKFGAANFYAPFPSYEKLRRFLGGLYWQQVLSREFVLTSKISSQYSNDEFTLIRDNPGYYSNNHKTRQHTLEAGVKRIGKHSSTYVGASAYLDSIDSDGIRAGAAAPALGAHRRSLFAVFGEFSTEGNRLFANTGGRAVFGTYAGLSGQLLVGYRMGDYVKIYASAYRNFRLPTYTELFYADAVHAANPELGPETSIGGAVGCDYTRARWDGGVKLFINRSRNLIDWVKQPGDDIWTSNNLRLGTYYGLDLKLAYAARDTLLKLLYTWQDAEFEDDIIFKQLKYNYYFPEHALSMVLMQSLKMFSMSAALKGETEASSHKTRIYLNVRVSKEIGGIQVYTEALNLFDQRVEKIPGLVEAPRSYGVGFRFEY